MRRALHEFAVALDDTFAVWGSGFAIFLIMKFWAGAPDITAALLAVFASIIAAAESLPDIVKRMKERQHA